MVMYLPGEVQIADQMRLIGSPSVYLVRGRSFHPLKVKLLI